MKKWLLLILLLLVPGTAWAGSVSFGVELPNQRADAFNTPLAPGELATLTLVCDGKVGTFSPAGTITVDNSWFGGTGTYSCTMTVTDTEGRTSGPSNSATVTFAVAPPKAPTIVGVTYQ